MEANVFVTKLKAEGSKSDIIDLDDVFKDYMEILVNLATKDRGTFSLNVLCILCRNLEKIPTWRSAIDYKVLVTLTVECTRETRTLNPSEDAKRLACIYHIHKHVVRQNSPVPPELTLKLSYVPFETDNLTTEYCKTFWNILADRITLIEKLKTQRKNVIKLLQKFTDDVLKVIKVYNTVQFISMVLTFLVKKLHLLFSDLGAKELNNTFGRIFEELQSKTDIKHLKKLPMKEIFDVYIILNDCLYVVAENTVKSNFEDSTLTTVVRTCISLVGHQQDLLHCLQSVYLNGFCTILNGNRNLTYVENILSNFVQSCETTEKLGYAKAINATYPYINQYLRLYIEANQKNWPISEQIGMSCLNLMEFLLKKLKDCNQILKCENCLVKSGLHDALRLAFVIKNIITVPLNANKSVANILPKYLSIILRQYEILDDLCRMGCANYDKCFKKSQSDVHNTAILLNKSLNFEYSIKLFDLYLKNEIIHFKNEGDLKNISRALYNKSICELDFKQYDSALLDAYLSLVFAYPDGLTTQKYMSLVMDIKAKVLKTKDDDSQTDSETDDMQTMTVVDACAMAVEEKRYGNLKPFFSNLKFSALLKHEFEMYAKLWPAIAPIAGVWKTLHDLTQHDVPWLVATDEAIQQTLYEVIFETPTVVRSIHNEHLLETLTELVEVFEECPPKSAEDRVFHATLMFLKAEFDLAKAGVKFGWKSTEPSMDPEKFVARRTLAQEHDASKCAIAAVLLWTDLLIDIRTVPKTSLQMALQTAQVFVPQLLHLHRMLPALQLAHICCQIAEYIEDKTSYLTNASAIMYYANKQTDVLTRIVTKGSEYCAELLQCKQSVEAALVFLGDCAIYYNKTKSFNTAARITQGLQARILSFHKNKPELNLDLAVGKMLEAQAEVCKDSGCPSGLSSVIGTHRHYLATGNTETKWCSRRHRALHLKLHISRTGVASAGAARSLLAWRRARSCAGAALPAAAAAGLAALLLALTDAAHTQHAQVQIDNHLKYILGIEPATNQPIPQTPKAKAHQAFTPKQELETMLENMTFKKMNETSPSLDVPGFKFPEFLKHDLDCKCYACENPCSLILACKTATLEASMYFRAKEFDIAKNYFDGSLRGLRLAEAKLKKKYEFAEKYLRQFVGKFYNNEFVDVEIRTLIEAAFFELSRKNYKTADECIITIHEILQENEDINPYLRNEILNLMTSSAHIQMQTKRRVSDVDLEADFENLKLSPTKHVEVAKTPVTKAKNPPKIPIIKAPSEEVPNTKRRVIKLNFDENSSDETETGVKKRSSKRTEFKIPVPVTAKPVLESITPAVQRRIPKIIITQPSQDGPSMFPTALNRKIPKIIITQPSDEEPSSSSFEFATPKPKNVNKSEFFTPINTPGDQFFTPMSTLKTYSKKSLRHGIVKNLETEFGTPKAEAKNSDKSIGQSKKTEPAKAIDKKRKATDKKENLKSTAGSRQTSATVETGSVKSLRAMRSLKRATSPGKLEVAERKTERSSRECSPCKSKEAGKKLTRSSRLRQPVKFSLDEGDK